MKKLLQIFVALLFALLPLCNSVSAQNNDMIYSDENVIVYQNDDGSKTAIITLPDDIQQGDSILVYSDPNNGTKVYIDIAEMSDVIRPNSFGYGSDSWSGSVPGGTTRLIPHIKTSLYTNVGFTMNISSIGATISSAYDPAITALTVTVSDVTINVNRSLATSSNPAYATMNWKATETQSGIVVATSYCYLRVYMNNVRQLRMEWYA